MIYKPGIIVFTDLDGTLLDLETYSYEKSLSGIEFLRDRKIPVVFCSSKTREEQEVYRQKLKLFHPFIVENGGAIFIPMDYFSFTFDYDKQVEGYFVIELGIPYKEIRDLLIKVRQEGGFRFKGFGDMSIKEVSEASGLDLEFAKLAKLREYSETLNFDVSDKEKDEALKKIEKAGLNWARGGRFYGVMGGNDKGKATAILCDFYRRQFDQVKIIGLGDSQNDIPMLSVVDTPILVQKLDGTWEEVDLQGLRKIEGIGPEGWSRAVKDIVASQIGKAGQN